MFIQRENPLNEEKSTPCTMYVDLRGGFDFEIVKNNVDFFVNEKIPTDEMVQCPVDNSYIFVIHTYTRTHI